jgi:O-antigen/teichoic acid export membrane protein
MLVRNTAWNMAGQAAPAFIAIAALPVLTRSLGPERFGILAIAWLILAYMLEFGCGRATTKFVAELLESAERQRISSVSTIALLVQAGLGVLLGGALALAAPVLVHDVLRVGEALRPEAVASFVVLAAAVPFVLLAGAYRGVLEAAQRFDLVNAVRVPGSAATYLLPVAGVLLGWDLVGIVALLAASRALMAAAYAVLAWRVVPETARLAFSRSEVRAVAVFGGWLTVSTIVSPVLVYSERLALGAFVSVEAVGIYAGAAEAITRLLIVPASLIATLFPAFSALLRSGDRARVQSLGYRAVKYLTLLLTAVVALILPFAEPILAWWLGPVFADGAVALQVLGIGVVIATLGYIPSTVLQAAGRADITAKLHLVELPLFALLLVVLVPRFGIAGAAMAWTARCAADAALLYAAAARLDLASPAVGRYERLPQVLLTTAVLLGSGVLASLIPSLALRLALVAGCIPVAGYTVWRLVLSGADRTLIARAGLTSVVRA